MLTARGSHPLQLRIIVLTNPVRYHGTSPRFTRTSPGPPVTSPVDMPQADLTPNPDTAEPSERIQRRPFWGWFTTIMKRSNHNRMPYPTRSEESQTNTPQTKVTPSNEQPSMMSPAQRVKVSVLFLLLDKAWISDQSAQRTVTKSTIRPQVR